MQYEFKPDRFAACATIRSRVVLLAMCVAAVVSGCSSAPLRSPESGVTAPADAGTAPSPRRGGGYYKDDGPHDRVPEDLDAIPDAEPRVEPLHRFANRPYTVFGQDYVPATALAPYRERGIGSWYGRRFHGKPTSSGESYDMYAMTAAHPTLPIPSYVRVTNLGNGRSVVVRVNDRGPFHKGRIIDLSYAAAHRLGYVNRGSARVEVESILPGEVRMVEARREVPPLPGRKPALVGSSATQAAIMSSESMPLADATGGKSVPPASEPVAGVFLQLGVFSTVANAEGFRGMVKEEFAALTGELRLLDEGGRYRLHLGPYASVEDARVEAERIAEVLKIRPFVVNR